MSDRPFPQNAEWSFVGEYEELLAVASPTMIFQI